MAGPASPTRDGKLPVSVCVMACNDEDRIASCLEAVSFADEIVVAVDTKSSDGTEKIARELATRVEVHRYEGDLEQKRWVTGLARHDWVLSIDSDEVVSEALAESMRSLFAAGDPPRDGYELDRVAFHLGRWVRHGDWHPDWKLRLFRRAVAEWVGINPHGRVRVAGSVERLAGELRHYSFRDLSDQIDRIQVHSSAAARALYERGRRAGLLDLAVRPPARFLRSYLLKRGFQDGVVGLVVAGTIAYGVFLKYAKLWELSRAR